MGEKIMGEAFDRSGHFLGSVEADSKREVFDKLNEQFKDAAEIRIRTLEASIGSASAEMPRYKSHKVVHALKIAGVEYDVNKALADGNRETDGSAMITPADDGYAPFRVDGGYVRKHLSKGDDSYVGGYYVVYAPDGYASFSPAGAFESGYTRI